MGYGIDTSGDNHALLWIGSGDSAVDLQTLLPATGTWTDSTAYSIDSTGHIYGIADGTYSGMTGTFGVEWLTSAPILGDANLDGVVNSADFDVLMNGYANGLSGWSNGDFNEDGVVNSDDWALFQLGLAAYQAGAGIAVPEPVGRGDDGAAGGGWFSIPPSAIKKPALGPGLIWNWSSPEDIRTSCRSRGCATAWRWLGEFS